ncbi:hypothetical protein SDC9_151380 [bioreactor metagenome]|uniref:Uncharacterized protein n=1 Tax=bioreactor metagenome TaxID=1076179 RepID=A0A645EUH8_9ZZZZ
MPQVLILGIVGLAADLQGDVVGLRIVDLLVAALDVPLSPGRDDGHIRRKALNGKLETHLIVALAGAAVADGVGMFFFGDLHQPFADDGAGKRGAQQILLIAGAHLHGWENHLVNHLVGQILYVQLGRAGLFRLFLQAVQLAALAHVGGHGDNLRIVVVLLQPGNDDGCVQAA